MKIVLGFIQIVTNLTINLEIPWPEAYKTFISWFNPANLDFVKITGVDCATKVDYYDKLLIFCVVPAIICLCLVIFYLIPGYYFTRDMQERKLYRRKFWKLFLFTLFLIYPSVSSTVVRVFVCKRVLGTDFLVADFEIQCENSRWQGYAGLAGAMLLIYPIGIPVFFFATMWRYRKRLDEPGIRAQLGFLYDGYHRYVWWFEMPDMAHKLFVTSLIAFFPLDWQMPVAMLAVHSYTISVLLFKPHLRDGDDRLHQFAQIEIFSVLLAGYVFQDQGDVDEAMEIFMAVVLIGLTVGFLLFFVFLAVLAFRRLRQNQKRRKAHEEMDKMQGFQDESTTIAADRVLANTEETYEDDLEEHVRELGVYHRKPQGVRQFSNEADVVMARNPVWDQGVRRGDDVSRVVNLELVTNPLSSNPLAQRQFAEIEKAKRASLSTKKARMMFEERDEAVDDDSIVPTYEEQPRATATPDAHREEFMPRRPKSKSRGDITAPLDQSLRRDSHSREKLMVSMPAPIQTSSSGGYSGRSSHLQRMTQARRMSVDRDGNPDIDEDHP